MRQPFKIQLLQALLALILAGLASWSTAGSGSADRVRQMTEPVFGSKIFVDEYGIDNKNVAILVHGLGDAGAADWAKLAPRLARRFHLVVPDLPGFGRSEKGNKQYSPDYYSQMLDWLIREYSPDQPVTLIGHSMGGAISVLHAGKYPEQVEKLVVIDAAGILHRTLITKYMTKVDSDGFLRGLIKPAIRGVNAVTGKLIGAVETRKTPEELQRILARPDLRQKYLDGDPGRISAVALITTDFSEALEQVRAPSLVIWGRDDKVAPLRTGYTLANNLPQSRFRIIDYAGHAPINTKPQDVARLILDYLDDSQGDSHGADANAVSHSSPARCTKESNVRYTGNFRHMIIRGCKQVTIENATVESIEIRNSHVTIRNSIISGSDIGINMINGHLYIENSNIAASDIGLKTWSANVTVSGARIEAATAVYSLGSNLDLAGANLLGTREALKIVRHRVDDVLFSASRTRSPNGKHYLHGIHKIRRNAPL